MRNDLFAPRFYNQDLPILRDLGLRMDTKLENGEWIELGEVRETVDHGYRVRVSVMTMPAMFWRFDITPSEGNPPIRLDCGSGSLRDYWPIAQQFAESMIVAELLPVSAVARGDTPNV